MKSKQHSFVYPYLFLTFFLWGSLYVVSKHVLGKVPPFTLSLLRYVIAVVILFLLVRIKNYAPLERKYYKQILLIGFFGYFLSQVLQFMGTKLSNASFAALINSLNPVAIMVMAAVFLHEKLTAQKIAGLALSLGASVHHPWWRAQLRHDGRHRAFPSVRIHLVSRLRRALQAQRILPAPAHCGMGYRRRTHFRHPLCIHRTHIYSCDVGLVGSDLCSLYGRHVYRSGSSAVE